MSESTEVSQPTYQSVSEWLREFATRYHNSTIKDTSADFGRLNEVADFIDRLEAQLDDASKEAP